MGTGRVSMGISTYTYDVLGDLVVYGADLDRSDFRAVTRRITRTKLLDGGAYVFDGGFSDGDRDILLVVKRPEQAMVDRFIYLAQYYAALILTTEDGAFKAHIAAVNYTSEELTVAMTVEDTA